MKNIKYGALAQQNYTLSWTWHSREEGPEGVSKGLQVSNRTFSRVRIATMDGGKPPDIG
jgi:hypothetical protein